MLLVLLDMDDDSLQRGNAPVHILGDLGESFVDDEQPAFTMIQSVFDLLPLVAGIDRNSDST